MYEEKVINELPVQQNCKEINAKLPNYEITNFFKKNLNRVGVLRIKLNCGSTETNIFINGIQIILIQGLPSL